MADTVLLIADTSDLVPLADALAARGFAARGLSLAAIPTGLDLSEVRAIVLADAPDPAPKALAKLFQTLGSTLPPIVAMVAEGDRGLRDQCLVAGACDVAPGTQPEDVAGRVDAAVHGWLRTVPRRKLQTSLRAQRGRQLIDLQVVDIDPTGFGIVPISGVPTGSLLRTNLILPDGEMLIWGRLAHGDDDVQGVRFVALLPEDRKRLISAIKGRPAASIPPRTVRTSPPSLAPGRPATEARATAIEPTLLLNAIAIGASNARLPAEPSPPADEQPVQEASPPEAAKPSEVEPIAEAAPAAGDQADTAEAAPAKRSASIAPAGRISGISAIGDAIGELLGDEPSAEAPVDEPGTASFSEAPADANLPRWPTTLYVQDACIDVLGQACTMGLAGEEAGAPSGERVLAFLRTLTTFERRAFDAEPPPELPELALAQRCLATRLRLFALAAEANTIPDSAGPLAFIDLELFNQINADAKAVNADLQKELDGFVASAQTLRIKEVNTFRNALTRSVADLRGASIRLRVGVRETSGNVVLLDVEHKTISGKASVVHREAKEEKKDEPKNEFVPRKALSEAQRRRRRVAIWLVLLIPAAVGLFYMRAERHRSLAPDEFSEMRDIKEVVVDPKKDKAWITATAGWHADAVHLHQVEAFTASIHIDNYVVMTSKLQAMAFGKKGRPVTIPKGQPAVPK